jgi:hypothetical protein
VRDPSANGILAGPDAPGHQLERATAAPEGTIPKWGQTGSYIVDVNGIKVRIKQSGMLGIGSMAMFWPSFEAHAVEYDKPFHKRNRIPQLHGTARRGHAGYRATPVRAGGYQVVPRW